MCNLETAEKLKEILDKENCGDCPLDGACDLVDGETNQGSICTILKNEKENTENE